MRAASLDFPVDKLDLSGIDAGVGTAGDDAFRFIGSGAFTGAAGELHAILSGGRMYLKGDVNGDRVADFPIILVDDPSLTSADLVL